ncbi:MAG: LysR family transcriptional regulator [Clostridiaceae bacterium]|jgi:DNA-binding transcriptional LysR family regulator|nr:LysR family transcriptional regulator [Clostridiaceae bacterium]
MDVNFELYKVFHTVAKTGSFSAAARELFISQSAVSQSIKNLEECTGSLLFARGPRRVKLTAVGEMLYSHVEQACNLLNKAEAKIREMQSLDLGEVKIGVGDTILRYLLIPFLQKFIRDYPNIKLKIINRTSLGIINSIRTGAVDLGIVTMPISDSDIDAAVLCEVEDVFIASSRFSSLENRPVSLEELAAYPLMLLQKESSTRKNLDSFFISKGIEITPEIELESMDLLVELARIGLGIAYVLKECAIQFVEKKELFMLQLKEPSPKRQLAIASLKNVPLSPAAQAFREKLREYGQGLAGDSSQV